MGGLLGELGKKLAERWLSLLVLPGALYLATTMTANILGHAHALDVHRLTGRLTAWANAPAVSTAGGQVVLLSAVLAGAAAAGLAAQGLGSLIERLALAADWRDWPSPLRSAARWQVTRRQVRWNIAHTAHHELRESAAQARAHGHRLDPAQRHAAHRAMNRIAAESPDRPTWSGDRIHASAVRLDRELHLDLVTLWPHLWLTLPEAARTETTTARQALTRATTFGGWALLYAPLTIWWWPAAPLAVVLAAIAWQRTRTATDTYALLLEAATRVHAGDLARKLGIDHTGPLDADIGDDLTRLLRTQPLPPAVTETT